jgi:hypothetical protein
MCVTCGRVDEGGDAIGLAVVAAWVTAFSVYMYNI